MRKAAKAARTIVVALATAVTVAGSAFAQEQRLVEEVVARVNADVITRSQYLEVLKDTENELSQQYPPEEARRRFEEFKPKVLDLMIDNLLVVQKGQDLGFDVEAQVNQQMTELARQQNNMSITEFEEAIRRSGIEPSELRQRFRERLMRDMVMNQEVYSSVYRNLTEKEKREYYDKNKERFMVPGELKLSELFLSVEGRSFSEIETKARDLAASARAGTAFTDLVRKSGDPNRPSFANNGSLGSFKSSSELAAPISTAIESLKTGEVTDPIRLKDGVIILRVDERREASAKPYEDVASDVALALTYERSHDAEVTFVKGLRETAYIKITDGYVSEVAMQEMQKSKDKENK